LHEVALDGGLLAGYLNDLLAGICGFTFGHLFVCNYTYKHRQYVIERLNFEKENKFDRDTFDLGTLIKQEDLTKTEEPTRKHLVKMPMPKVENRLLAEYPFAEFVTMSDLDIQRSYTS